MKHTMTMFIAHKQLNQIMDDMDLKGNYKWYTEPKDAIFTMEPGREVNTVMFNKIIDHSYRTREVQDFWIPAIKYMDNMSWHPTVKIISDGKYEMFLPNQEQETNDNNRSTRMD